MSLFVSTFMYAASKLAGDAWDQVRARELANADESTWPGVRTIGQIGRLGEEAAVYVDGGTLITKGRSRAAAFFLRSSADVWVSVDDDMFAAVDVVRQLVAVCRHTRGLVGTPAVLRDGRAFNFRRAFAPVDVLPMPGTHEVAATYCCVDQIGQGLVAMHRELVTAIADQVPQVAPGTPQAFPAIFLEYVDDDGVWIGEDVALCKHAERLSLPLHMLCNAPTNHGGKRCQVDERLRIYVGDDETAAKVDPMRLTGQPPAEP